MDFRKTVFVRSYMKAEDVVCDLPGIALLGRSNVGKSSFINRLCGNGKLAKTSGTPGKTRAINCFRSDDTLYIYDLPGYGYAKAGMAEQLAWSAEIEKFLAREDAVSLPVLFIDVRHEPTKDDLMMKTWIDASGMKPLIIANKCDKLPKSKWHRARLDIAFALKMDFASDIVFFSSETGYGRDEVIKRLSAAAETMRQMLIRKF